MKPNMRLAYMLALKKKMTQNKTLYDKWIEQGNTGTVNDFVNNINNMTPYEFWLSLGNKGTMEDFVNSKI